MLARAAFPAFFFTLGGFILLLLVTLSVPLIKSIYLLQLEAARSAGSVASASARANVGVFGICYSGVSASVLGFSKTSVGACTKAKLGYELDPTFFDVTDDTRLTGAIVKGVSRALVLNPIGAGFAVVSLLFTFFAWCCSSRLMEVLGFVTLIFSALVAWLVFFLDLALVLVARSRVKSATDGLVTGRIGNAVWLGLAAAISLTLACVFSCCGMFGRYRRDREVQPVVSEKPYAKRQFVVTLRTADRTESASRTRISDDDE